MVPYDPEATKARVFAAAVAEFAEHGFAGARVARIAERAGANKQAIYLYFGSKAALFGAVLEDQLTQMSGAVHIDPTDLQAYVGAVFDFQQAHPEFLRLLLWEALEGGEGPVVSEPARASYYQGRVAQLGTTRERGTLADRIAPGHLWLALIGMVNWISAAPQEARLALGLSPGQGPPPGYRKAVMTIAAILAGEDDTT